MLSVRLLLAFILAASSGAACSNPAAPGDDGPPDGAVRVLFIGNSLTYTNDLPSVVAFLAAEAGGAPLYYRSVVGANVSLEDHWRAGTAAALRSETWDFVVMQQGPSSLPENQVHLRTWAGRFAEAARDAGAEPALYMVWPSADRRGAFDAVAHAYAAAADSTGARLLPAGDAWRAAWARRPSLSLYGADGFHPSRTGTVLAALTIYGGLYGDLPVLPVTVPVGDGTLRMTQEEAAVLVSAAREALATRADGG